MTARVLIAEEALDRLTAMGVPLPSIERAVRYGEAESATCTALDPPITGGFLRYARTTRGLREELVPLGWDWDSPSNFCRVIHPSGTFAIVAMSGDEATGVPNRVPTTKYAKGLATVRAVETNGQLVLDYVGLSLPSTPREDEQLATWLFLYHRDQEEIRAELSLPSAMDGGAIADWQERIILPAFPLDQDPLGSTTTPRDEGGGDVVVEVSRR